MVCQGPEQGGAAGKCQVFSFSNSNLAAREMEELQVLWTVSLAASFFGQIALILQSLFSHEITPLSPLLLLATDPFSSHFICEVVPALLESWSYLF